MVRVTRFGWHEGGPVGREFEKDDWLDGPDDEVDSHPKSGPERTRSPRRRDRKNSPGDRTASANRPHSDVRERPE